MVKAPDAYSTGGYNIWGISDGIAGDGDEQGVKALLPLLFTLLPFTQFPVSVSKVMDELSSSFGPYEIGMGVGSAHLPVCHRSSGQGRRCSGYGSWLNPCGRNRHREDTDRSGNTGYAERRASGSALGCDTEFLRNLRRGETGNGIENVIAIQCF